MNQYIKKLGRLFFGILLCGISMVMAINANVGLGPWNAFHVGITKHTSLTVGGAGILTGCVIVLLGTLLGQLPGWGTLLNMVFVGLSVDFINQLQIIPQCQEWIPGVIMLIISLILMGIGTYFYLSAQIGAGPRDGLMVALVKKTDKPVWIIRNGIEAGALLAGALLGAPIGIGTVIYVTCIGSTIQGIFRWFRFDTKNVIHRSIRDDYYLLKQIQGRKQKG
ncbi:hypothetical protein QBE52_18075 [Clostridiaceae bacterium 35-E11]